MRVLILGPWTIGQPSHGGALRASAIVRAYEDHGHVVRFSGLYDADTVGSNDAGPDDLAIPAAVLEYVRRLETDSELAFWEGLADTPAALSHYVDLAANFEPDIIQFEEPYMWPIVRALLDGDHCGRAAIVYSSYNFETHAKQEIKASGLPISDRTLQDVADIEAEIAQTADLVVAVSDADAAAFRSLGAKRVQLAPNGCTIPECEPEALDALRQYTLGQRFALFVSSAHPPNAAGLLELAERTTARLDGGMLLVAGGVSRLVYDTPGFWRRQHIFRNARFLGVVSGPMLGALYHECSAVLLPKTRGGGSNLKTAEALCAGRPIVATTKAFEGFERFMNAPGIFLEDNPGEFWSRVGMILGDRGEHSIGPLRPAQGLGWPECLAPMVEAAETVTASLRRFSGE